MYIASLSVEFMFTILTKKTRIMKKFYFCNSLFQLNKRSIKQLPLMAFLMLFFCPLIMVAIFSSCSNEEYNQEGIPILSRKHFANDADLDAFIASFDNSYFNTKTTLYDEKASIIDVFKENTAIGSILNKKLEFEVADTIYKFGESGYTIYAIEKNAYKNIQKYLGQEKSILQDIESYPMVSFGKYQLEKGILLYYTGNPIIEVTRITVPIPTRVSQDGRTKVQASYWRSRNLLKSSCGVQVEAWSRENMNTDFTSADTDLELFWDIFYDIPVAPLPCPNRGSKVGHGNIIREQLYWCTGYYNMSLKSPSHIVGRAKCWDGSWIAANIDK